MMRQLAIVVSSLCLFASAASSEIVIEGTPRWGFDGKARVGQFNLVTFNIANDSDQPWEGNFEFQPSQGFQNVDIRIIQPANFIEGFGRRRLQFLVYLPQVNEFRLKWGRRSNQQYQVDEPKIADGLATVQLTQGSFNSTIKGLGTFDEADFPASAAGLDGLGSVVLDHVPTWTEPQQQAFLDWLLTGGEVHLYHQSAENFPEFSKLLTELNNPEDQYPLGGGRVIRHATTLKQSQQKFPRIKDSKQRYPNWRLTTSLFSQLKEMTQPDHNWFLIYSLAILYLLLLFPGCWLLGRKQGDYRITYGAILGIVVLFSMGFHAVGSRGYGENTSFNSVAIVKPARDGRMLVTQWSNLFVTNGGVYDVKHAAEGLVYSTGQMEESVLGVAFNRPIGLMKTDVPSFSSRTILHAGIVKTAPLSPQVKTATVKNENLNDLKITLPEGQQWPTALSAKILYKNKLSNGSIQNGVFTKSGGGQNLDSALQEDQWRVNQYYWNRQKRTPEELYNMSLEPMIAHDLNLKSEEERSKYSLPDHKARVYLLADMPEEFFAQEDDSTQQNGRVLYVFDVPVDPK